MKLACAAVISLFLGACATDPPTEIMESGPLERVGTYLTGAHPVTAVVVDIDDDGDSDLIAPALLTGDVVVLQNNDGELSWLQVGPLEVGAGEAIVADIDGDGALELVTSNRDLDRVDIYDIRPDPDVIHVQTLDVTGATGLVAADLDGDGDTDLAVTGFRDDFVTFFEQVNGALVEKSTIATGEGPFVLRAADIDQSGFLDLVVSAATASSIEIYSGDDWQWTQRASVATADWPSCLLVSDGDGALEILGTATVGDTIFSIALEDTTEEAWTAIYNPIGAGDGAFALTRFEGGLAVTNKDASTLSLLSYDDGGSGQLSMELTLSTGEGAGPTPVLEWDYNQDGRSDLIVLNAFTDELVIYRGTSARP